MLLFADYTAQDYFKENGATLFPAAEVNITRTCLTYLSFDAFRGQCNVNLFRGYHPYQYKRSTSDVAHQYPLLDYAAVYWGHHARSNEESTSDVIRDFLSHKPNVAYATAVLLEHNYRWHALRTDFGEIHLLSFFGLEKAMSELLKNRHPADSRDSWGQTPLSHAAVGGRVEIVRLLLTRDDVDMNSKDKNGRSPLSYAAENRHLGVVQLFLAQVGIDVDAKDGYGRSPLSHAARNGHLGVVQLFSVRVEVHVNAKDEDGRSPLSYAAENGHLGVVQLFLARVGIDVDAKDGYGQSPLSHAADRKSVV